MPCLRCDAVSRTPQKRRPWHFQSMVGAVEVATEHATTSRNVSRDGMTFSAHALEEARASDRWRFCGGQRAAEASRGTPYRGQTLSCQSLCCVPLVQAYPSTHPLRSSSHLRSLRKLWPPATVKIDPLLGPPIAGQQRHVPIMIWPCQRQNPHPALRRTASLASSVTASCVAQNVDDLGSCLCAAHAGGDAGRLASSA